MAGAEAQVSAVVVNYNTRDRVVGCLRSLVRSDNRAHLRDVTVVDNASVDESLTAIAANFTSSEVKVLRSANRGYGAACNLGAMHARGDTLLFLNADIALDSDACAALVGAMDDDGRIGVAGLALRDALGHPARCRFLFPHHPARVLSNLIRIPFPARERAHALDLPIGGNEPLRADWILGATVAMRRRAFDTVRGFDSGFFLFFEEIDLCRRARDAGWTIVTIPTARAVHVRHASIGQLNENVAMRHRRRSQRLYFAKHYGILGWMAAVLDRSCLRWRI